MFKTNIYIKDFFKKMIPFVGEYTRLDMLIYGFIIPVFIITIGALLKELYFDISLGIIFFGLFLMLSGIFKRSWNMGVDPFIRVLLICIPMIGIAFYFFLFIYKRHNEF